MDKKLSFRAGSNRVLRASFAVLVASCMAQLPAVQRAFSADAEKIVFGIVPQQSATRLAEVWVPLLDRLSEDSGYAVEFATAKDIPTFEACLARGAYDVAYMNPYHYTVFHSSAGYEAFAFQAEKRLRGVLVARVDSDIDDLRDLEGSDLAFPSPAAFGASVIPRAELRGEQISFTPHYVNSHDSVYRSVALGLFSAGGGVGRTLGNIPEDLRSQLRVIYQTAEYTPHAFASSADLSDEARNALASALLAVEDEALLSPLGMTGFEAAADADWDDVRSLNLTDHQTEIADDGELQCLSG